MTTTTRTQSDVFAEITNALAASITDGAAQDPAALAALWYEMGRLAARDRTVPGWAQVAAMTLGDRYAAEAATWHLPLSR